MTKVAVILTPAMRAWMQQGLDRPDGLLPRQSKWIRRDKLYAALKEGLLERVGREPDPEVLVDERHRRKMFMRYRLTEKGAFKLRDETFF